MASDLALPCWRPLTRRRAVACHRRWRSYYGSRYWHPVSAWPPARTAYSRRLIDKPPVATTRISTQVTEGGLAIPRSHAFPGIAAVRTGWRLVNVRRPNWRFRGHLA